MTSEILPQNLTTEETGISQIQSLLPMTIYNTLNLNDAASTAFDFSHTDPKDGQPNEDIFFTLLPIEGPRYSKRVRHMWKKITAEY